MKDQPTPTQPAPEQITIDPERLTIEQLESVLFRMNETLGQVRDTINATYAILQRKRAEAQNTKA